MSSSSITLWTGPIPSEGMFDSILPLPSFIKKKSCNANSVDLNQTPRSAVSDLAVHYVYVPFCGMLCMNWLRMK